MDILEKIRSTVELPTIPTTLSHILDVTGSEQTAASDLAKVVVVDQALAANILRVANSALYSLPRKVTNVERAVALLGFKQVRDLSMSMSVFDSLYRPTPDGYVFDRAQFWQHGFITAYITREIAKDLNVRERNAFTAGLLHDIGKVVLDLKTPKLFERILQEIMTSNIDFHEAEMALIGTAHDRVGALVLEQWDLPDDLMETVKFHHAPSECKGQMPVLVYCANCLARTIGFPSMDALPEFYFEEFMQSEQTLTLQEQGRLPDRQFLIGVYEKFFEMRNELEEYSSQMFH